MNYIGTQLIFKLKCDHVGLENAISGEDLADFLDLGSTRLVRSLVEELRQDHIPILSLSGLGYWWTDGNVEDESHCIKQLRDMGSKFFRDAEYVEKGLLELVGDPKMF